MKHIAMVVFGVVLGAVSAVRAATVRNVPGDYATIALALEAADPGDTVLLAPGTYDATGCAAEGFMITLDKDVMLKGAGAKPSDTIITGGSTRQVLNIISSEATVENLTLRDGLAVGSSTGAGYTLQMSGGLVTNCIISGGKPVSNSTAYETAVFATGGRITDCEITEVLADTSSKTFQRAPVYLKNATMDHCDIHGNLSAHKYLGVVTVEGEDGLVEFCKIHDNTLKAFEYAYRSGAVAAMNKAMVRDSEIYNNTMEYNANAYHTAAGVSTIGGSATTYEKSAKGGAVIERCVITNNIYQVPASAKNSKNSRMVAGVMMGYQSVLRNCLVAHNANVTTKTGSNTWPICGGVVMTGYASGARIVNCTIADNSVSASSQDANLANGWFSEGTVTNTIIDGAFLLADGATTEFAYSRTDTLMPGEGNVTGDCAFKDPAAGDYHLTIDSSTVRDKAIPLDEVTIDLDGVARPFGSAPDIGCYEYFSDSSHSCAFVMESDVAVGGEPFSMMATADPADGVYAYVWTFERQDGTKTVVSNFTDRVHTQTLTAAGEYAVGLTVLWGDAGEIVATADAPEPQPVTVYPRRTYVAVGGTGVWPYDKPENAAGSFADAYAAVYKDDDDPGFVRFAAGTYSGANALDADGEWLLTVDGGVIVEGASSDRADTVIDATGARAVKIASRGAQFRNFTIVAPSNHMAETVCGYGIDLRNGIVENVQVTNMVAVASTTTPQTYEHAVYVAGGVLRDVELVDKKKKYDTRYGSGCGAVIFADGGLVDGCLVHDTEVHEKLYCAPVVVSGTAVVTNSIICGNKQHYGEDSSGSIAKAGGIYAFGNALVVDCTVTNNVSTACGSRPVRAGGVAAKGSARIVRCLIADNAADLKGNNENGIVAAGLCLQGTASAVNCLIVRNSAGTETSAKATDAGGVYLGATATMVNCTVADNVNASDTSVAGVKALGTMINDIVWRNALGGTPAAATYCCTPELLDGEGNIAQDPKLKKGYRIRASSPCVEKGDPSMWTADDVDLAGNPRVRQGTVDMGCYQATLSGLMMLVR